MGGVKASPLISLVLYVAEEMRLTDLQMQRWEIGLYPKLNLFNIRDYLSKICLVFRKGLFGRPTSAVKVVQWATNSDCIVTKCHKIIFGSPLKTGVLFTNLNNSPTVYICSLIFCYTFI